MDPLAQPTIPEEQTTPPATTPTATTNTNSFLQENKAWVKFVPAILVWPLWLYTINNHWEDVFEDYWPMTIAMIAGSFIAGSTPLGGGVVAFPVSVLLLKFNPVQARDASVLVQSIGMNAAAYLLMVSKPHLLNAELIISFTVTGTLGIILGHIINPQPTTINVLYTLLVFEFGIIFFYTNVLNPNTTKVLHHNIDNNTEIRKGPLGDGRLAFWAGRGIMLLFGIAGGIITSTIGSGSDIFLFLFGLFVWNILYPEKRYSENVFTASSVVVMGAVSAATAMLRALNGGFDEQTLYAWGAMVPVVVVGAPIGSIVITPNALPFLRMMFYFLSVFQFIMFASLKIRRQRGQWIAIAITTGLEFGLLCFHYHASCKSRNNNFLLKDPRSLVAMHPKEEYDDDDESNSNNNNELEMVEMTTRNNNIINMHNTNINIIITATARPR